MQKYYVYHNGHSWFVKEAKFFADQGGLVEEWGKNWKLIKARSIEDARARAEEEISHA